MPVSKTYGPSAGKQRYHKHRVGRMLLPHGRVSGLLFTVNPRQEPKALRELQLYLHPLIADLEREGERRSGSPCAKHCSFTREEVDTDGIVAPSTSSLLAAELAEHIQSSVGGKGRTQAGGTNEDSYHNHNEDRSDDDDDSDNDNDNSGSDTASVSSPRKRQRHDRQATRQVGGNKCRWLAPLDTGCKGHLMLSIPFPPIPMSTATAPAATATPEEGEATLKSMEDGVVTKAPELQSMGDNSVTETDTPYSRPFLHNPLVQMVVERVFKDIEENPRPLLRHCFRLMPCELTCCPTLLEMRAALGRLIDVHFPLLSECGDGASDNGGNDASTGKSQQLHCVGFNFSVKNNTKVGNEKAYLKAVLETTFPANRFVVIPDSRRKGSDFRLEAVFCVLVAHATCAMGVQRRFSERSEYNLHAIGEKHLQLSNSV